MPPRPVYDSAQRAATVTAIGFAAAVFADTPALRRGHPDGQAEGSDTGHVPPFTAVTAMVGGWATAAADTPLEHEPGLQCGPHAALE